jgi:phosphohistidine phosphatase SixA
MADIVNLRHARKQKARVEKERVADQNRALYGRGKAERQRDAANAGKLTNFLDGHRRGRSGEDEKEPGA